MSRVPVARVLLVVLLLSASSEFIASSRGDARTLCIAGIIAISALVASIAGFAFCALAGTAFAYLRLDPVYSVHTLVVCSTAIQLYAVWNIRSAIRWQSLWPMIAAGAAAVPLGVWMLRHTDGAVYAVGLGIFLSAYGGYTVFRREWRVQKGGAMIDVIVGALGGLTGGLAGLPGPSVTIWCSMRGWDPLAQRATYQPFILAMQVVCIICLQLQGPTAIFALDALSFVPLAMIGGIAGFALYQRMTKRQLHVVMSLLLVVSGGGLLVRAV
jgi:uncharacterized membrane protein YfcA